MNPFSVAVGARQTPTLFDDVALAYAIDPTPCPVSPMKIDVDAKEGSRARYPDCGTALSVLVPILKGFSFYMPRVMQQKLVGTCAKSP